MKRTTYSPKLSRREFLTVIGVGAGVGVGIGAGVLILQNRTAASRPSFPRAASTGQTRNFVFEAAPVQLSLAGKSLSTWAYNGGLPGPEIRVTEGDTIQVTVKNRLPQETSLHWHGVPLVNAMDGVPDATQKAIASQQDFVYTFQAPTAGTFFYHSHVGLQLDRGLYGPLIVESTQEQKNYDHDFVLVLDDWLDGLKGTPDDAMKQLIASGDTMDGMNGMGNTMQVPPDIIYPLYLISGHSSEQPLELQVTQGQRARIRFINASAATMYRIALQGHRMTITHTDGQPVEPVEVDTLRLGMGELYDVLVTANTPGVWQLAAKVEGAASMVRAILRYTRKFCFLAPNDLSASGATKADADLFEAKSSAGDFCPTDGQSRYHYALTWTLFQLENGTGRGPLKDTVIVDPKQTVTVNWISDNPGSWAFHCHNAYHQAGGMMGW